MIWKNYVILVSAILLLMFVLSLLAALQTLELCNTVFKHAVQLKVTTTAMCTQGQQLANLVLW